MLMPLAFVACTVVADDSATPKDTDDSADSGDTGDSSPDRVGECDGTDACGGDLTGGWTIASACADDTQQPLGEQCPEGYMQVGGLVMVGSYAFSADGTYTLDMVSLEQTALVHVPASCLRGGTCDDLAAQMASQFDTVECADGAPDGCDCTGVKGSPPVDANGTWATVDTMLTFTPMEGTPMEAAYCADADELWLELTPSDAAVRIRLLLTRD